MPVFLERKSDGKGLRKRLIEENVQNIVQIQERALSEWLLGKIAREAEGLDCWSAIYSR